MKKDKKTEAITFRTSKETKEWLDFFAEQRDWTISQLVERTITAWVLQEKKDLMNEPEEPTPEEHLTDEDILQMEYDEEKQAEEALQEALQEEFQDDNEENY